MTNKKLIITIISILLVITTIAGVAVAAVKYWPTTLTQEPSKDQENKEEKEKNDQTYTYQDLENLKNNFDKSYKDADLKNFENPTAEFKKSQEKFISDFKTKLETFQTEFNKIDKNNSDQINKLYKDYEQTVNECQNQIKELNTVYFKNQNVIYDQLENLNQKFIDLMNEAKSNQFLPIINTFNSSFTELQQNMVTIDRDEIVQTLNVSQLNSLINQFKPIIVQCENTIQIYKLNFWLSISTLITILYVFFQNYLKYRYFKDILTNVKPIKIKVNFLLAFLFLLSSYSYFFVSFVSNCLLIFSLVVSICTLIFIKKIM